MKKSFLLSLIAGSLLAMSSVPAGAQTAPPPQISETMYILPKRGMDDEFKAAVKAHNLKYHPEGPYTAGLRYVEYGEKAGWYVWIMGPTTFASFDSRPDEGAHGDDWNNTVDPLVEEYGTTNLWQYEAEQSFGRDILLKSGNYNLWAIDVKRGEMGRFNEIADKFKKTYESMGNRGFLVYSNLIHTPGTADAAFIASYTSLADWGTDWGVKKAYEKLYGEGSWQTLWKTWDEVVVDFDEELRSNVK